MCENRAGGRDRYCGIVAACGTVGDFGIPDAHDAVEASGGRERPCCRWPRGGGLQVRADGG